MSKQHNHNNTMIKPKSPCNYNNSTGSSMLEPFSGIGENITRKLNKIGHDTAAIKPTLQQHNNPRLDPPWWSVLAQFLQRDENSLTSINMNVSNPIHKQRIVLASKHYKIGSSSQPLDDLNKISKLPICTQNCPQPLGCALATAFKAWHLHLPLLVCTCILLSDMISDQYGLTGKSVDRGTLDWQSASTSSSSMLSIYGLRRGFNHHPFFINYLHRD